MEKPFLYASGAALYIVIIVFVMQTVSMLLKSQDGTFVIPMTVLSMFVLSAAVMGFLFLSEPVSLLVENKKREAVVFFGKTVGFFACYAALFAVLVFVIK
jgi:hypothetical protein